MDELDAKLLRLLERDSRAANIALAKKLGVSEGTVRNRTLELVRSGVIKRFSVETASSAGFKAIVLVRFNPQKPTKTLVRFLLSQEGVSGVREVSGGWDVVCETNSDSPEAFNELIEKIRTHDGVVETHSLIVLKTV